MIMFMTPLSDFIVMVVDGNVGALTFATECLTIDPVRAVDGLRRMLDHGITGSKLYMIWNDGCNRDTKDALNAICDAPIEDLEKVIKGETL